MPFHTTGKQVGLFLSLAACALVVGTQSKGLLQRVADRSPHVEAGSELGLESAWPHLRVDLVP